MRTDITEQTRTEKDLFEAIHRLDALMKALPVGVSFSDDPSCQRITGNPTALAQFEVTPEDNLSASAADNSAPATVLLRLKHARCERQIHLKLWSWAFATDGP